MSCCTVNGHFKSTPTFLIITASLLYLARVRLFIKQKKVYKVLILLTILTDLQIKTSWPMMLMKPVYCEEYHNNNRVHKSVIFNIDYVRQLL